MEGEWWKRFLPWTNEWNRHQAIRSGVARLADRAERTKSLQLEQKEDVVNEAARIVNNRIGEIIYELTLQAERCKCHKCINRVKAEKAAWHLEE